MKIFDKREKDEIGIKGKKLSGAGLSPEHPYPSASGEVRMNSRSTIVSKAYTTR